MELALFPIAAILLLLSGAGAPPHLSGGSQSPAALIRRLLTPGTANARASTDYRRSTHTQFKAPYANAPSHAASHRPDPLIATQVRIASYAAGSQRYHTRFGVRSQTYLATAPPRA